MTAAQPTRLHSIKYSRAAGVEEYRISSAGVEKYRISSAGVQEYRISSAGVEEYRIPLFNELIDFTSRVASRLSVSE